MASSVVPIADTVPWDDGITGYDRAHFDIYLRLLDAQDAGASTTEMCETVLGRDPVADPAASLKALESHLARAKWLSEQGYRDLLKSS